MTGTSVPSPKGLVLVRVGCRVSGRPVLLPTSGTLPPPFPGTYQPSTLTVCTFHSSRTVSRPRVIHKELTSEVKGRNDLRFSHEILNQNLGSLSSGVVSIRRSLPSRANSTSQSSSRTLWKVGCDDLPTPFGTSQCGEDRWYGGFGWDSVRRKGRPKS